MVPSSSGGKAFLALGSDTQVELRRGWRSRQLVEGLNLHREGLADGWMGDVTMRGVESGPQVRVIL